VTKETFGSLQELLQRAQDLREKLVRIQEEAARTTVEASAGGGMVTATVNGKLELVRLRIDPGVFEDRDRELVEDLVVAAVNEALRRAQERVREEMGRLTGGFKIPGLFP
jgi:DNA-binding YbaB/EbfC family protein